MMWIGTRVGPLYVGRTFRGNSPDPKSEFTKAAIPIWGLLVLVTFFTVPVVTAFLLVGLVPLILACAVAEATHKTPEQKAEKAKARAVTQLAELPKDERLAQIYRVQHLAGRTVTHRAAKLLERRPDLEYVVYPERRPVDPYRFFTDEDQEWFGRFGS